MINSISQLQRIEELKQIQQSGQEMNQDFSSFLQDAITKLEQSQQEANSATAGLVTGEVNNFHTPVIALEKASLTMGLAVTVRNKVLDAYHEIMRMQI